MRTDANYTAAVRGKYNRLGEIWTADDPWHGWCRRQIDEELAAAARDLRDRPGDRRLVVDVGSGGDAHGLSGADTVHVDVAERRLVGTRLAVCCSAETLALASGIADLVVCVGAVVNYCSLEEVSPRPRG